MNIWRNLSALTTIMGAFAGAGFASEKVDLERTSPVPATEQIPIADFFRRPSLRAPELNPSGTYIAALVTTSEDKYQLLAYEVATQKIEMLGGFFDKDIYTFAWAGDKRIIFGLSTEKLYALALMGADAGNLTEAYPLLQFCGARIVSVPHKDRTHPLVWMSSDLEHGKDDGVVAVNTSYHRGKLTNLRAAGAGWSDLVEVRENNDKHIANRFPILEGGIISGYMANREGELEYAFQANDGVFSISQLKDGVWKKCPIDLEQIDVLTSGEKPGELVVLGPPRPGQPRAVQFINAASGQLGEILYEDQLYDFDGGFYRDPTTEQIVGLHYERNGPKTVWFSDEYKNLQKAIDPMFPGLVARIIDNNEAHTFFLVLTYSDRQPAIYHWIDLKNHKAGLFKNSSPWIDPKRMQAMSPIKFKTRDGHKLDAYLTLPAGASKTNLPPLVVLPHGGPWVRDTWGFDGEVQFLASRGYAVLQPNYRGSPGYSWMFPEEDEFAFRKMHDDVTDAAKAVIASGLADGKRVAIMGGSFGAYLALSGVAYEKDFYRCAVAISGVFDWGNVLREESYYEFENPYYGRMLRKLGDPKKDKAKFDEISPARHVDQVKVPVFVSHGTADTIADIGESKRLISELEKYKVPHEVLIVNGEGHGMHHVKNNVELYSRIEAFLAKNLAP